MLARRAVSGWLAVRLALAVLLALFPGLALGQGAVTKGDVRAGQLPTTSRQDISRLVEDVFDAASKTVSIPIERSLAPSASRTPISSAASSAAPSSSAGGTAVANCASPMGCRPR